MKEQIIICGNECTIFRYENKEMLEIGIPNHI